MSMGLVEGAEYSVLSGLALHDEETICVPRENRVMSKIERFEDLIAWQKARVLVRDIYDVASKRPFSRDFALRDQITRAAISAPA